MRLLDASLRPHIAAIYALVRVGDEIVDTYRGKDIPSQLDTLEQETKRALASGYSANIIVHAFALTAREFDIPASYVTAFFKSMRDDISRTAYTQKQYETYIYGSAEVVGLMCLRVFAPDHFEAFESGARRLGAGYQKVNFLRDIAADHHELGRWYFPTGSYATFNDVAKKRLVAEIKKDFAAGQKAALKLPASSRYAVLLSVAYYSQLLKKVEKTHVETLKVKRVRVNDLTKLILFMKARLHLYGA